MQTLTWYTRRLQRMSAAEIAWRGRSMVRDAVDRTRFALGAYPSLEPPSADRPLPAPAALAPLAPGAWVDAAPGSREAQWRDRLRAEADAIADHRFTFLNLEDVHLGTPIDWNRDHETGTPSPRGFAGTIDYRDAATSGDAKLVWEPSRHLQLPVLARAFVATGEEAYLHAAFDLAESWMDQCPFGDGMQWRSPLEAAIRAINWTWLLSLGAGTAIVSGPRGARLRHALGLHVDEIARKYSHGSSANNHRIGEAAGIFVATSVVPGLPGGAPRRDESRRILSEEILRQNHADGGNAEQAFGYHLFVLQFLVLSGFVARRTGQSFPEPCWSRLAAMLDFADAMFAAGPAPLYGDADDGYVIDLGGREGAGREIVAMGRAVIAGRRTTADVEPLAWMFDGEPAALPPSGDRGDDALTPSAFPDTGLYLLQWGRRGGPDRVGLTFDCGPLGFGSIAAHGHADALAVTLRAFGRDVLVDPGTYDYFRYPAWRDYFRSTRAHNTVTVDGTDQSQMLGPFMWGERATARCLRWTTGPGTACVIGEHDGYRRLADPVMHRRSVTMDATERRFTIADDLQMRSAHDLELRFHVAEDAAVTRAGDRAFEISVDGGVVRLELDPRLAVTTIEAPDRPTGGWVSRGYHRKSPSVTIVGTLRAAESVALHSTITVAAPHGTQP